MDITPTASTIIVRLAGATSDTVAASRRTLAWQLICLYYVSIVFLSTLPPVVVVVGSSAASGGDQFASPSSPASDQQAQEARCLACIRNASLANEPAGGPANSRVRCEGYYCGPFQLSYQYWAEAGKPGAGGGGGASARTFDKCARDRQCAESAVRAYFNKFKRDCNQDGRIDCLDMAALHKGGPSSCASDWFYKSRFWLAFNKTVCAQEAPEVASNELASSAQRTVMRQDEHQMGQAGGNSFKLEMKNQTLTAECLECICEAVSGCNTSGANCNGGLVCGPYAISQAYWKEARRPGASWTACARTRECSGVTMRNYMEKNKRDCNGDGFITCEDYAAIHKRGPRGCTNRDLQREHYWNKFLACRANQPAKNDANMVKAHLNGDNQTGGGDARITTQWLVSRGNQLGPVSEATPNQTTLLARLGSPAPPTTSIASTTATAAATTVTATTTTTSTTTTTTTTAGLPTSAAATTTTTTTTPTVASTDHHHLLPVTRFKTATSGVSIHESMSSGPAVSSPAAFADSSGDHDQSEAQPLPQMAPMPQTLQASSSSRPHPAGLEYDPQHERHRVPQQQQQHQQFGSAYRPTSSPVHEVPRSTQQQYHHHHHHHLSSVIYQSTSPTATPSSRRSTPPQGLALDPFNSLPTIIVGKPLGGVSTSNVRGISAQPQSVSSLPQVHSSNSGFDSPPTAASTVSALDSSAPSSTTPLVSVSTAYHQVASTKSAIGPASETSGGGAPHVAPDASQSEVAPVEELALSPDYSLPDFPYSVGGGGGGGGSAIGNIQTSSGGGGTSLFDKVVNGIVGNPDFSKSYPPAPELLVSGASQAKPEEASESPTLTFDNHQSNPKAHHHQQQHQQLSAHNQRLNTNHSRNSPTNNNKQHAPSEQQQQMVVANNGAESVNMSSLFELRNSSESGGRIASECLECICDASSNCDATVQCISKQREKNRCGLYMISWNQFQESDILLTVALTAAAAASSSSSSSVVQFGGGANPEGNGAEWEEKIYYECTTDRNCAERLINLYIEKHQRDCNGDGRIDCYDIAAIHRVGPQMCSSQKFLSSQYWKDFNICYTTDRLASGPTTTTATIATPSTAITMSSSLQQ